MARILRSENANIPVDTVLNLNAFDLDQVLQNRPTFLEPEYPFEWTGVYKVEQGQYELTLEEGPDPNMSLVALIDQEYSEEDLNSSAEKCVRLYADDANALSPGEVIAFEKHIDLQLMSDGQKSFFLEINKNCNLGLFTQHTAEYFYINLFSRDSDNKNI